MLLSSILAWQDWTGIILFLILSLYIGLKYASKAGESLNDFFLSGRNLPWYVAGFSMVATTFAADTPLAVTELVAQKGVSGNWLWWNMMIGGTLTVFFFSKLWRRAEIMTDNEIIELRYGGKPASFLRSYKAIFLGLLMNSLIIGWVNLALVKIFIIFFEVPEAEVIWYVGGAMALTAIYSAISGLWGVAITDFVQFVIAMIGCVVLAYCVVNTPEIGGIDGLKTKLPAGTLDYFPKIGTENANNGVLSLSITAFISFIAIQWWASWYPGAEPGGGGYVAQRMMSAKNEKHSLYATLFFQIAHYCLRPWPWILTGLATLILYPDLAMDNKGAGFVMAMRDYLPTGLKGLLLVTFLAAYMSTISTQLNWGASYFINDFYKRQINKTGTEKHYVAASRAYTIIAMLLALGITTQLTSITQVWNIMLNSGAGLGAVLILRWFWSRINVWSEITATFSPIIGYFVLNFLKEQPNSFVNDDNFLIINAAFTTFCWIFITFLTPPESNEKLLSFYERIQPTGWWHSIAKTSNIPLNNKPIKFQTICWISGILLIYGTLFAIGDILFKEYLSALKYLVFSVIGMLGIIYGLKQIEKVSNPINKINLE